MFFANINFLRAFAALLVVVYHVVLLAPWPSFPTEGAASALRVGWVGVDLFFVISGFVIGLSALRLYRGGVADFRTIFLRRRLARIVPLYIFTGAAFLILVEPGMLLTSWTKLAARVGSHLVFLHNLHPRLHSSLNGANWSVAAEMQFYVLAILAVPLLSRIGVRWIFAGGLLVAWCSRALAYWLTVDLGNPQIMFVYATQVPSMLDQFAIGICIARLYADGTMQRFAARYGALTVAAIASSFAIAAYLAWHTYWAHSTYWDNPWMVVFWRTALALAFGALVLLAAQLPDLTRLWPLRPLNYLGEISYGIYLWHLPVILSLKRVLAGTDPEHMLWMTLACVFALSALTWHLFERPIIRRFR